jgi:hypothetical protein
MPRVRSSLARIGRPRNGRSSTGPRLQPIIQLPTEEQTENSPCQKRDCNCCREQTRQPAIQERVDVAEVRRLRFIEYLNFLANVMEGRVGSRPETTVLLLPNLIFDHSRIRCPVFTILMSFEGHHRTLRSFRLNTLLHSREEQKKTESRETPEEAKDEKDLMPSRCSVWAGPPRAIWIRFLFLWGHGLLLPARPAAKPANDTVHLTGPATKKLDVAKNRNAGPVKCNALVRRRPIQLRSGQF